MVGCHPCRVSLLASGSLTMIGCSTYFFAARGISAVSYKQTLNVSVILFSTIYTTKGKCDLRHFHGIGI
jgi:hypothetical protein